MRNLHDLMLYFKSL